MPQRKIIASVIIVNYNGKAFLSECLDALLGQNYPKAKFEIIMVDNNSYDTSVAYTRKYFPTVKVVESKENLGFAGGCNLGVENSSGKYIIFLNNDTRVKKDWLVSLVNRIESDKKIAAVNSKILLYFPFIELSINSDIFMRSEFTKSINFQPVGVLVENVVLENQELQHLIRYRCGFYDKENGAIEARWTKGMATILIPCNYKNPFTKMTLTVRSEKTSSNLKTKVSINLGDEIITKDILEPYEVKQYKICLENEKLKDKFLYAIQNSGVVVFKNGYGRDRGAVVGKQKEHFYELDNSFYNKGNNINAFCGGSVIIRKDIFENLGGFDKSFFMYYEDVDLSLKMKRIGYKIVYEPKSVVFHIHAGSSGEWSSLFTYNVEKNHLAVMVKHFPIKVLVKELFLYFMLLISSILKMIKWRIREHWELYESWKEKVDCRINVIRWFLSRFIQLVRDRQHIIITQKYTIRDIYKDLY